MSANRDTSQGIGFVYLTPKTPKKENVPVTLEDIRRNLDRLQKLHQKLHQVLAELSVASGERKNRP